MRLHEIKNDLLRHFLATLAYRERKAIVGAPAGFAGFDVGHGVRTPVEIVSHMSGVLTHAYSFFGPGETRKPQIGSWEQEVERFFQILSALDRSLELHMEVKGRNQEQLLQGPLADTMTHVGQLAMLRRMASSPIPKESFDKLRSESVKSLFVVWKDRVRLAHETHAIRYLQYPNRQN